MKEPHVIQLKGICKSYPRPDEGPLEVLRNIEININEGDYIAIVGPSGSGKSTLMNILGLLDHADSGEYLMDGENVSGLSSAKLANLRNQKIGFVFQQFHLLPRTTAIENVEIPLVYSNADNPEQRAIDALKSVGLGDRMKHMPEELSGGQQQRVAIARALVTDPELILADEPTGNLDKASGEDLMALLQELNDNGRTIVVITHDENLAKRAKRTVRIDDGRLSELRDVTPDSGVGSGETQMGDVA
ncbi:MAG: ABC transporter ATP-binding protein [Rhodospirillaceae bacterium]|nr:ABC transporter ATP-binding protein [Rhodospirillaceae bacterium]MBT5239867.1 ABC transporter ATP-binding protein [Rhodospirillaceae bacterium]MBT5567116.1 ABC transporter ATP-binding protein [Rhodospirillaceae bacterium]MBT6089330.1 ABC transporter ATP-binding protein [Rhodospirillaceae bacterium]MBT6960975.1 ABC transporter ATP-binding protein [Rhodospirillaceae bacterium]